MSARHHTVQRTCHIDGTVCVAYSLCSVVRSHAAGCANPRTPWSHVDRPFHPCIAACSAVGQGWLQYSHCQRAFLSPIPRASRTISLRWLSHRGGEGGSSARLEFCPTPRSRGESHHSGCCLQRPGRWKPTCDAQIPTFLVVLCRNFPKIILWIHALVHWSVGDRL